MGAKLTKEGYEKLKEELLYLQTTRRKEVVAAIAAAREHGDLKENAEYDAAKNEQGFLEKRIAELNDVLAEATVIDDSLMDSSKALLGATLTILDINNKKELNYKLVDQEEANFREGKISVDSPVGKGLLGKEVGDEIEINIPAGTLKYKLLKIER